MSLIINFVMNNKDKIIRLVLIGLVFLTIIFIVLGVSELYNEDENEKIDIQQIIDRNNAKKDLEMLKFEQLDSGIIILKEELELN